MVAVGGAGVAVGGGGVFVGDGVTVGAIAVARIANSCTRVCVGPTLIVGVTVGACATWVSVTRVPVAFLFVEELPKISKPAKHTQISRPALSAELPMMIFRRRRGVGVFTGKSIVLSTVASSL